MAYFSGHAAALAVSEEQSPEVLSQQVNKGLGEGFTWGWPAVVVALVIEMWTRWRDPMARFLRFPRGAILLSTLVSAAAAIAIIAFDAPPAIFILATWAGATAYMELSPRINRRLGRRRY